jgi:hypothetical protein
MLPATLSGLWPAARMAALFRGFTESLRGSFRRHQTPTALSLNSPHAFSLASVLTAQAGLASRYWRRLSYRSR